MWTWAPNERFGGSPVAISRKRVSPSLDQAWTCVFTPAYAGSWATVAPCPWSTVVRPATATAGTASSTPAPTTAPIQFARMFVLLSDGSG